MVKNTFSGVLMLSTVMLSGLLQAQTVEDTEEYSCGYAVSTGVYADWGLGYNAWAKVTNVSGVPAASFELFLDLGESQLRRGWLGTYQYNDAGYSVLSPSWLSYSPLKKGRSFHLGFLGQGSFDGIKPYVISVNGEACDTVSPEISLSSNKSLFTSEGSLTISADASDNVAVKKVVFKNRGEVVGEDYDAPYTLDLEVSEALNGRHAFTATAYDYSGNSVDSEVDRVFVAIGNRFLGSVTAEAIDYDDFGYFNQLTPGNAGKWGSVESTQDVMNWQALDTAYQYAKDNNLPFKMHTLVWGQQQPSWITDLPLEEQIAEIEEWMAAVAERYPDIDTIDVVNEPLHAKPAYIEALGGDGETGWDWLIKSFELARSYFPDAQLLINDYNILILDSFTNSYLEPIAVLQERGLVDGIGLQAHFLERADNAQVEANLATLSALGLPIYISEFDLNFANDAQQANRMRDLFTIFWNNPAVVGVTHWGHLENRMWRDDAYLIREDKSLRPAMEWLLCYYRGESNCTVPEYVPTGWVGNEEGLTLEAEQYDEAEGLLALGGGVAYTDDTDWIKFSKVSFLENWDLFSVKYAKGNTSEGSISIHLGSMENDPILSVELPPTAGWGTSETLTVAMPQLSGEHEVYVRFNGTYGVANVDYIRFGIAAVNLVSNPGFEDGSTSGWFSWDGTVSNSSELSHSGENSLLLSGRSGNGPAAYGLTDVVSAGSSYDVSMFVTIAGAEQANVNVTRKLSCGEENSYSWMINPVTVSQGEWTKLSGQLVIPEDCDVTDVLMYAEGPEGGIDIYIDDVAVYGYSASSNILTNGDFESGNTSGWFSWDGTLAVSEEVVYEGDYALKLSERAGNGPAATSLTDLVTPGETYNVSLAVTISGAAEAPVNLTRKITCDGSDAEYGWVANSGAVTEGEWTVLSGQLEVPDCVITDVLIYAEGPEGGIDIYLDSVEVSP